MSKFSNWLRDEMNEKELSISKLSSETYITRQTISDHLKGTHVPYRSSLRAYALYFGVDYWDLYEMVLKDIDMNSQ